MYNSKQKRKENSMPVSAKQLNFCNISNKFDTFYNQNQDNLLSLLDEFINISDFIPFSFYQNYYSELGSKRDFSLESMLSAFILKNILTIPLNIKNTILQSRLLIRQLPIIPRMQNITTLKAYCLRTKTAPSMSRLNISRKL